MPLSKQKQAEWMRAYRRRYNVIPKVTPLYNPYRHKAGDQVMVRQGKRLVEAVIPNLDADGNVIPEY